MPDQLMVNLPDGTARPLTDAEGAALSATFFLSLAEPKLRTYPSLKQLRLQQDMLSRKFHALLNGIGAVDRPDRAFRKQIAAKMREIEQARQQLFDLEMERRDLERGIDGLKAIRAKSVQLINADQETL
jgi:septal ring factor EnvC (AmiA/AmiB activator)